MNAPRAAGPELRRALEAFVGRFAMTRHLPNDPIAFPHNFSVPVDREVVALLAACLAYGRADLIRRAMRDVSARIGDSPGATAVADDEATARARFDGFVYRVTRGVDLVRLWMGAGRLLRAHGSLGAAFTAGDNAESGDLRPGLIAFRHALRTPTEHFPYRRGFEHLLPDPAKSSACKRLWLFMRWMVRGPDSVDFGLWSHLDPGRLIMPVDTHIHRIALHLGLTDRTTADLRAARAITEALRTLDPHDPVRFDFALAHLGISGRCPRRRVRSICVDCDIRSVCRLDDDGALGPGPM